MAKRYYSVEVKGIVERDRSPEVEVHDWINLLKFIKVTKVDIKHRSKRPTGRKAKRLLKRILLLSTRLSNIYIKLMFRRA